MNNKSNYKKGVAAMVGCAALWSISGLFIKLLPWNAMVIAGIRSLIAAAVLAIYMAAAKIRFTFNKRVALTGLAVAATFACFCYATKLTTAANAIVLEFTAPIYVLLFSALFFKKRIRHTDIIVVVVTLIGISLFFFDKLSGGGVLGNILALVAGVFFAGVHVLSGDVGDDVRMSGLVCGNLLMAVIGMPFMAFYDTPFTLTPVLIILVLGIFQLGIPYVLYGTAAKYTSPLACSLLGAFDPLLNPVWVLIFMGERPGQYALFGGVIVIAAVSVWCMLPWINERRKKKSPS